jgi:hypothetical protein
MSVYVAIVETKEAGHVQPLWTSRDPELLQLIRKQIEKRLTPTEIPVRPRSTKRIKDNG